MCEGEEIMYQENLSIENTLKIFHWGGLNED
jgi:hypothetical protein